jgi:hypothetical protein
MGWTDSHAHEFETAAGPELSLDRVIWLPESGRGIVK